MTELTRCPNPPPLPTKQIHCPFSNPAIATPLQIVRPAHANGAALNRLTSSGNGVVFRLSATMYSAKQPCVVTPTNPSMCSQYCVCVSGPTHSPHVPHGCSGKPTMTRSPTLNPRFAASAPPTRTTVPAPSCEAVCGSALPKTPDRTMPSVWQLEATATLTSRSEGWRRVGTGMVLMA